MSDQPLPYGIDDLEPPLRRDKKTGRLRCPVRDCEHWLIPPTRKANTGEFCPDHGIYVHSSGTYRYADYRRNLLVDPEYFHEHIRYHPSKYEAHRFGMERSEDCLSWAVMRSLQRAGLLKDVVQLCTGIQPAGEPKLYLWGLEIAEDGVREWDLLHRARERFESDLPVQRPKTEPDIALYQPGEYLILIEAKFCSGNGVYIRDGNTKLVDLTLDQLITIYRDPSLRFLNYAEAHRREAIHYQLWRNLIFAEWMAADDGSGTRAYHVNLVRDGCEEDVCGAMLTLMNVAYIDRFEQISWEQLYELAHAHRPGTERLCRYMEQKTERLKPAFRLSAAPGWAGR